MGTLILYTFRNICQYRRPGVYPYGYENNIAHMSVSSFCILLHIFNISICNKIQYTVFIA